MVCIIESCGLGTVIFSYLTIVLANVAFTHIGVDI